MITAAPEKEDIVRTGSSGWPGVASIAARTFVIVTTALGCLAAAGRQIERGGPLSPLELLTPVNEGASGATRSPHHQTRTIEGAAPYA